MSYQANQERYSAMKYNRSGKSGIVLPDISRLDCGITSGAWTRTKTEETWCSRLSI